jgi:hypothetical protein
MRALANDRQPRFRLPCAEVPRVSWRFLGETLGRTGSLLSRADLTPHFEINFLVTVGTVIADCPPYRSVRAGLPHTALTLD